MVDFEQWAQKEDKDFSTFILDTEQKLGQLKDLDLEELALDEAREINDKLKESTGMDLSTIVP